MVIKRNGPVPHDIALEELEEEYAEEETGRLPALPSLNEGTLEISGAGAGGINEAELYRKLAWSGILAGERKLTFDYVVDFVPQSHLELPEERESMQGKLDLFWTIFGADCANRQGRMDALEDQCNYWIGRMDSPGEQATAEEKVNAWGTEAAKKLNLRVRKARYGFESIDNNADYKVWKDAEEAITKIESEATELTSSGYHYYLTRINQLLVQEERAMDAARGITEVDFTAVKKLLRTGKDIQGKDILDRMPWVYLRAFDQSRGSKADGTFDAAHMEAMMHGTMAGRPNAQGRHNAPLVSIGTAGDSANVTPGGEKAND